MMDECGICNGPGAIYECGCSCDCDGNQLDALGGVTVATATVDADMASATTWTTALDLTLAAFATVLARFTGCSDIPAGDCDCDGNQLDALGVCGGDCTSDANGNGVCDDAEVAGCTDSAACNYDAAATEDDGSCDFCSCARAADYTLTVEAAPAADGVPLLR